LPPLRFFSSDENWTVTGVNAEASMGCVMAVAAVAVLELLCCLESG
jgi:hypothetical protein